MWISHDFSDMLLPGQTVSSLPKIHSPLCHQVLHGRSGGKMPHPLQKKIGFAGIVVADEEGDWPRLSWVSTWAR